MHESNALLTEDREGMHRARRDHDFSAIAPEDPREALDAHHFAERFGLFLIILLGEVVISTASADVGDAASWAALAAAMVLAAALWWLYFDAAVEINREVLERSGGSTSMARAIFAVGHMLRHPAARTGPLLRALRDRLPDVLPRPARAGARPPRLPLAADGLDGDVRRARLLRWPRGRQPSDSTSAGVISATPATVAAARSSASCAGG